MTLSEFGRAVAENRSGGTEHGHGGVMFVIGGGIRGGRVYGEWPGLNEDALHEGRDVAVTTDFRDVLAEVITSDCRLPRRRRGTSWLHQRAYEPGWSHRTGQTVN